MKTFKEIEAFVRKAIKNNLLVGARTDHEFFVKNEEYTIFIYNNLEHNIVVSLYSNRGTFINRYDISITDREGILFNLLLEDIRDYLKGYTQDILDNFFGEDNSTKTVDDLEFDDENHNQ